MSFFARLSSMACPVVMFCYRRVPRLLFPLSFGLPRGCCKRQFLLIVTTNTSLTGFPLHLSASLIVTHTSITHARSSTSMADHAKTCPPQDLPPPVPIGDMPSVSVIKAAMSSPPIVKLEDEVLIQAEAKTKLALVAYSSSPPSLIEDHFESSRGIEEATSSNGLQLLRSKYAASLHEYVLTVGRSA